MTHATVDEDARRARVEALNGRSIRRDAESVYRCTNWCARNLAPACLDAVSAAPNMDSDIARRASDAATALREAAPIVDRDTARAALSTLLDAEAFLIDYYTPLWRELAPTAKKACNDATAAAATATAATATAAAAATAATAEGATYGQIYDAVYGVWTSIFDGLFESAMELLEAVTETD